MMPTWQTATSLAAVATLLCLYSDRHHLRDLILEAIGVHDLRRKFKTMEAHHLHLMEEQRLELEKKMKEKELEQDKKIATLERKVIELENRGTVVSTGRKPSATFFDLPQELRDEIYDLVASDEWKQGFCPFFPDAGSSSDPFLFPPNYRDPALAQVNRQIRAEFLPRFHRLMLLGIGPPLRPETERWLRVFEDRLPLIRNFRFQIVPLCDIYLSGGLGRSDGLPTRGQGCVARPLYEEYRGRFRSHIQQLVESLLIRGKDGLAYLSIEGLRTIGNFSWSFALDSREYERDPESFVFKTIEESKASADAQLLFE